MDYKIIIKLAVYIQCGRYHPNKSFGLHLLSINEWVTRHNGPSFMYMCVPQILDHIEKQIQ